MKSIAVVAVVLLALAGAASASSPLARLKAHKQPQSKATPFPFTVCPGTAQDLKVTTLYVTPNPPVKGSNIGMQLIGTVDEQLTTGSSIQIQVAYSGVVIYNTSVDMSQATTLPAGPGAITLNYSVLIPGIAPSGAYTVQLTFQDQTSTAIGCISLAFSL